MQASSDLHTIHELWRTLRDGFFIDEQTHRIRLSLATHNPATASFAFWRFDIRQLPSGSFRGQAHVYTAFFATTRLSLGSVCAALSLLLVAADAAFLCYVYIVQPHWGVHDGDVGSRVSARSSAWPQEEHVAAPRRDDWGLAELRSISTVAHLLAGSAPGHTPVPHEQGPIGESTEPYGACGCPDPDGSCRTSSSMCPLDHQDAHGSPSERVVAHRGLERLGVQSAGNRGLDARCRVSDARAHSWRSLDGANSGRGRAVGEKVATSRSSRATSVSSKAPRSTAGDRAQLQSAVAGARSSYGGGSEATLPVPPLRARARRHGWMAGIAVSMFAGLVLTLTVSAWYSSRATDLVWKFHAADTAGHDALGRTASEYLVMHVYHDLASPMRRLLPAKAVSPLLRRAQLEVVEAAHEGGNGTMCDVSVDGATGVVDIVAAAVDVPLWTLPDDPAQVDHFADLLVRSTSGLLIREAHTVL